MIRQRRIHRIESSRIRASAFLSVCVSTYLLLLNVCAFATNAPPLPPSNRDCAGSDSWWHPTPPPLPLLPQSQWGARCPDAALLEWRAERASRLQHHQDPAQEAAQVRERRRTHIYSETGFYDALINAEAGDMQNISEYALSCTKLLFSSLFGH